MPNEISKNDVKEIQGSEMPSYRDIKPESDISVSEANKYWDDIYSRMSEVLYRYYTSSEDRLSRTPLDSPRGHWEGERGESKYVPSHETEEGKAACDKLEEKGMDGIEYNNGEPDFSKCAEATVEISDMTENRSDYYDGDGNLKRGNFSQADLKCEEQWNESQRDGKTDWKAEDVRNWRRENGFSWHERCDTRTMDLVPQEIHGYFSHSGGCAECKTRDAADLGGGFDD